MLAMQCQDWSFYDGLMEGIPAKFDYPSGAGGFCFDPKKEGALLGAFFRNNQSGYVSVRT